MLDRIPEIDAKNAVLSKGLVLELPHASLTLEDDSHRAVYREKFDTVTRQYQVRRYWS